MFGRAETRLGALLDLELARLRSIVNQLLEMELTRAPFRMIAVEKAIQATIGGLEVSGRIDRIDELDSDGGLAVIDYKTGTRYYPSDWFKQRPRDLQLPFYASALEGDVDAVVIAMLHPQNPAYKGIWLGDGQFPGRGARLPADLDWATQRDRWRTLLEDLAREFGEGDGRIFRSNLRYADAQWRLSPGFMNAWHWPGKPTHEHPVASRHMSDAPQRQRALETGQSFIVQAPAGSGKTELLIQRYLALLATVELPEQIIAITFTRKAAAQMRDRVLAALTSAARDERPGQPHQLTTFRLARRVLARDRQRGWSMTEQPARLKIDTLDALNVWLAQRLPVSSGGIGAARIVEDASSLYVNAGRRLMQRLGDGSRNSSIAPAA